MLKPYAVRLSLFLLVALAIATLIPIKRSSRYQYIKDKPWQGALLTAPYDFPIYKSDTEIEAERDSVRLHQLPVYSHHSELGFLMMQEWQDEYNAHLSARLSKEYFAYVNEQLQRAYQAGVIDINELKSLREQGRLEVLVLGEGNELKRVPTTKFRTLKEVHEQIYQELPKHLDVKELQRIELVRFLKENIVYNAEMTERLIQEAVSNLSPSVGIVQAGQRIVDKGELVNPYTYSLLRSLEIEQEKRIGGTIHHYRGRVGFFIVMSIALSILFMYLNFLVRNFEASYKNIALILTSIFVFVVTTSLVSYFGLFNLYMIPYVMVLILLRSFMNSHTSLISFVVMIILSALFVSEPLSFVVVQMLAGLAALVSLQRLTSRGKMIRAAFVVYLTYSIVYLGMYLVGGGDFEMSYWKIQLIFGINLIFLNFTYILSAVVERAFGYVSNVSLVELSDINAPLLRELSEVAPGTFQHALQVSILAVEAADKVGGDVQLIRAGALYHDIGKIKNPAYFTENQGANNPHHLLDPRESAGIIVRHVIDGIALAQKHNLPPQIIDFIRTHHGDGLVRYFYNTYCNLHPQEVVDTEPFSYPGPKPFTREQGILMLADATEASSRSLKEYSYEHIYNHVHRIVDGIVSEGSLNDTPLSFRDIQTIKEVFIEKLKIMYHTRIAYPEKNV